MPVMPLDNVNSGKRSSYLRNAFFTLVGLSSAAVVTGGYLHIDSEIDSLRGNNTQLTERLDTNETARASLIQDLAKAQTTIARLETGMSNNETAINSAKKRIDGVELGTQDNKVQIAKLGEKDTEHDEKITGVNKSLETVTVKVNGLEKEVSISDIQNVIEKGLKSAVAIELEIKHKEKDDKGKEVEQIHSHYGSGYVVAHINDGKDGGFIATNWHVIECDKIKEEDLKNIEVLITLPDRKEVKGRLFYYRDENQKEQLARRKDHDLVLLKVTDDISETVPVEFASEEPKVGEGVVAIGVPFGSIIGKEFSATFGIVSGKAMVKYGDKEGPEFNVAQKDGGIFTAKTDAVINPGSSGCPAHRISDGKMVFMPTFIHPANLFVGNAFGVTAPTISNDVQTWTSYNYQLSSKGQLAQIITPEPIEVASPVPMEKIELKPVVATKP